MKWVVILQLKILFPSLPVRTCLSIAGFSLIIPPSIGPHATSLTLLGYVQKLARARVRRRLHVAAMQSQTVGVSAVSRTVTDALWKHTWSSCYVLPAEVLWHPPFDPPRRGSRGPKNKPLPLTGQMWSGQYRKRKCWTSDFRWARTMPWRKIRMHW